MKESTHDRHRWYHADCSRSILMIQVISIYINETKTRDLKNILHESCYVKFGNSYEYTDDTCFLNYISFYPNKIGKMHEHIEKKIYHIK